MADPATTGLGNEEAKKKAKALLSLDPPRERRGIAVLSAVYLAGL